MVNRNLLRQFDLNESDLHRELEAAFTQDAKGATVEDWLPIEEQQFEVNKIVKGRVLNVIGDDVVIDVGYKSEGVIKLDEWYDEGLDQIVAPKPGDEIQVLLDSVEDESGAIVLSYRKAKRQKEWEQIIEKHKEGTSSPAWSPQNRGRLAGDIGVNVFRPARSMFAGRDIGDYINRTSVQDPQDRRGRRTSSSPAQADRRSREEMKKKRWPRSLRTDSQGRGQEHCRVQAPSSTWAESTACCISPT